MRFSSAVPPSFSVRLGGPHPFRLGLRERRVQWFAKRMADDARLFAATWLAGFLGFSLFLA